jgi:hypothetical protein
MPLAPIPLDKSCPSYKPTYGISDRLLGLKVLLKLFDGMGLWYLRNVSIRLIDMKHSSSAVSAKLAIDIKESDNYNE